MGPRRRPQFREEQPTKKRGRRVRRTHPQSAMTASGSSANLSTDDLHHDIEAYRMEKKPRGKCIIINNIAFDNRTDIREGAEHDAKAMESLFRKLHFYVTVYRDVTAEDLELLLSRAAMADEQKDADCLIVILMSHGAKGVIASKDGKTIPLSSGVYRWFNKDFCPALGGKPKLFFIQACRKCPECPRPSNIRCDVRGCAGPSAPQSGNAVQQHGESFCFHGDRKTSPSAWTDMYCAYATIPGYPAIRDKTKGSRFFLAIESVFVNFAQIYPLDDLMNKVAAKMEQVSANAAEEQTSSVVKNGWKKRLYFNL